MQRLNPEATIAALQKAPIFAGMESAALQEMACCCRCRTYAAEQLLFCAGDPGQSLFLVVRGAVNIQSYAASGHTIHHARRGPGDVIGEMALLTGAPRTLDAVIAEETDLLALDRDDFLHCLDGSPLLARNIIACLAHRLVEAGRRLEGRQELDVTGRLAQLLLELAGLNSSESVSPGEVQIATRLTDSQIAERIGSTRATVNRKLAEMESLQAVRKVNRQITILNVGWLKRRAAE